MNTFYTNEKNGTNLYRIADTKSFNKYDKITTIKKPTKDTVWRMTPFLKPITPPINNNSIMIISIIFTLSPHYYYITKSIKIKVCFPWILC